MSFYVAYLTTIECIDELFFFVFIFSSKEKLEISNE